MSNIRNDGLAYLQWRLGVSILLRRQGTDCDQDGSEEKGGVVAKWKNSRADW